ncbi:MULTISPECIES: HAMP domain-containing sensor histidine kinase [Clostridium]|uniref:histidine kinase n=1 Tax=Clostridium cibarium TaxID=2762247 RepID=A0ABR8PUT9_9CLOT|nr:MULTISPECIES: HAMP domain-containing sensor histidine kinase [Clostridium]MBD7911945.1 HAMP domain-containing protein [Clostridium cibarium]
MQSIRRKFSILFVICSMVAVSLIIIFVNITINNKFDDYMADIQEKRYERIVSYFEEVYKREGNWNKESGIELMHEAYMGNYCLALLDKKEKPIWAMDADELKSNIHLSPMEVKDSGVYNSKRFEIKADDEIVGYVDIGQYSSILLSEEDVNFKASINKSIILSGVITLAIIIGVSLYFSKQLSNPIKEVASMSVNLAKGNFDKRSATKSNIKELENLRESINVLAEKLKYQDILRRRLISDISHEIRTPLNVLQNNVEAMIDGIFPITKERLNYLNDEVVRFGKLLNNLNVLKEFERESIKLDFEILDLSEILKIMHEDFILMGKDKNIEVKYNSQSNKNYNVVCDKDKIKQVFINIVSNAIKFTKENGEVTISLFEKSGRIIVEIKDNGMGIEEEDLPFVFERLYRGDRSRHVIEGSGIGLTIVKNILDLHSASIDVKSKEGKGTKVSITFNKIKNN